MRPAVLFHHPTAQPALPCLVITAAMQQMAHNHNAGSEPECATPVTAAAMCWKKEERPLDTIIGSVRGCPLMHLCRRLHAHMAVTPSACKTIESTFLIFSVSLQEGSLQNCRQVSKEWCWTARVHQETTSGSPAAATHQAGCGCAGLGTAAVCCARCLAGRRLMRCFTTSACQRCADRARRPPPAGGAGRVGRVWVVLGCAERCLAAKHAKHCSRGIAHSMLAWACAGHPSEAQCPIRAPAPRRCGTPAAALPRPAAATPARCWWRPGPAGG